MDQVIRVDSHFVRLIPARRVAQEIERRAATVTIHEDNGFYRLAPIGTKGSFQAKDVSYEYEIEQSKRLANMRDNG